jgi:Fe2+ transport system protein FeoA
LGILEGSQVIVLRAGDPLMLLAKDTRIAVDPDTAAGVEVTASAVTY